MSYADLKIKVNSIDTSVQPGKATLTIGYDQCTSNEECESISGGALLPHAKLKERQELMLLDVLMFLLIIAVATISARWARLVLAVQLIVSKGLISFNLMTAAAVGFEMELCLMLKQKLMLILPSPMLNTR